MSKYLAITELVCVALVRGGGCREGVLALSPPSSILLFSLRSPALLPHLSLSSYYCRLVFCASAADTIAKCRFLSPLV